jgi:hypothetical protein
MLGHVRGFVGQHAGELRFRLGREQQAGVHSDEASRHSEGVDGVVAHHEELEVLLAVRARRHDAPADVVHVLRELGIVEVSGVAADLLHYLLADLALELRRQQRTGRIAQLRERLGRCLRDDQGQTQEGCRDSHG